MTRVNFVLGFVVCTLVGIGSALYVHTYAKSVNHAMDGVPKCVNDPTKPNEICPSPDFARAYMEFGTVKKHVEDLQQTPDVKELQKSLYLINGMANALQEQARKEAPGAVYKEDLGKFVRAPITAVPPPAPPAPVPAKK